VGAVGDCSGIKGECIGSSGVSAYKGTIYKEVYLCDADVVCCCSSYGGGVENSCTLRWSGYEDGGCLGVKRSKRGERNDV